MQHDSLIGGRYRLGGLLGSGGMGRVFRAYDERLGREVALKVLAEHHASSPEFVERFGREVASAASLSHPNIVRVFDSGTDEDGTPYMAMELVPGGTLKDKILAGGPLPPREAAGVICQVAEALGAAHDAGIVHRDVKPENVLLTGDGGVKVADFGIARATEATAMTHTSMILGTVPYLSPEQAGGGPVGPASDLYSLGVVLYESLTGETPFGGGEHDNPLAVAMKHLNEPAPPPRAANDRVPRELDLITLTLLRKRPEERYPDAGSLVADLEALSDGRAPTSPAARRLSESPNEARTGLLRRAPYAPIRRRRKRVVLPLMALALAAVLGLFAGSLVLAQRPVSFVEDTISGGALDRAASPTLAAHPGPPEPPDGAGDAEGADRNPTPDGDARAPRPAAVAPAASAPASAPADGSATASATGSATAAAGAPAAASVGASAGATAAEPEPPPPADPAPSPPAAPSGASSPPATGQTPPADASAPPVADPAPPDASAAPPVADPTSPAPAAGAQPADDGVPEVEIPEVEVPEVEGPDF